jgi:hypothetical protein
LENYRGCRSLFAVASDDAWRKKYNVCEETVVADALGIFEEN